MADRQEEIERIAALALASLVEVAWADGQVTPAERAAVLEASRLLGLRQRSEFCRTTLYRWLEDPPPTEALEQWRQLLAPTLAEAATRPGRKVASRLLREATKVAKMDARPMDVGASIDPRAGITYEEQRVLDDLATALGSVDPER